MNINWDFEKLSAAPTKMNTCKLYVLVFCWCIKSYHKLKTIFSSQVCRSEIWQGVSESPARGVTRPRPKERAGLSPHLRSRGETHVIAHLGHWRNSSPWGCRTEGPVSLLTVSRGPPLGLWGHSPVLACGPPVSSSQQQCHKNTLQFRPDFLFCSQLFSLAFKAAGVVRPGPPGYLPVIRVCNLGGQFWYSAHFPLWLSSSLGYITNKNARARVCIYTRITWKNANRNTTHISQNLEKLFNNSCGIFL